MSEMVERVARVIDECLTARVERGEPDPVWRLTTAEEVARAAIAAMREPTPAMFEVAKPLMDSWSSNTAWWQAMIDAALSGSDGKPEADTVNRRSLAWTIGRDHGQRGINPETYWRGHDPNYQDGWRAGAAEREMRSLAERAEGRQ